MPTYSYRCPNCESLYSVFKRIADLDRAEWCTNNDCREGLAMVRQVVSPAVAFDYAPYNCPITGKLIEGRKAHEENLKKHGCRVYESGETQEYERRRKADEEAFDRQVEAAAVAAYQAMPETKRQQIAAELIHGAEAPIIRK